MSASIIREAFRIVTDMENDLEDARVMADGVAILAVDAIEDQKLGAVLMRIGRLIGDYCEAVEERRGKLFHLLHPNREKEGWLGDDGGEAQS